VASIVGWLDYSEEHRQKMREIIDLFRDEDSVDEIGIGSIRDTFAELLFPGLSTVQTRARYFLLIPWVYRRLETERVPSAQAAAKARNWQTQLVHALERGGARGNEGVIGWDARENLQRLPSAVYWAGLKSFGIRLFSGSIEDYHRSLDSYQRRVREYSKGEGDEVAETFHPNWTSHLPDTPGDLWTETSIELSPEEAAFLQTQVALYCPKSLLAHYLEQPTDFVLDLSTPWEHPAASTAAGDTALWLHHARLFSEVMHGAALAYNLMLAERAREVGLSIGDADLVADYTDQLGAWVEELRQDWDRVGRWDLVEFWSLARAANPRIPHSAQMFAERWSREAVNDPERLASLPQDIRLLIADRELRLKRGKARLQSHRALEMWSGHAGVGRLTYRWPTARIFIADIHRGLGHA
jgi:hypothetical protein